MLHKHELSIREGRWLASEAVQPAGPQRASASVASAQHSSSHAFQLSLNGPKWEATPWRRWPGMERWHAGILSAWWRILEPCAPQTAIPACRIPPGQQLTKSDDGMPKLVSPLVITRCLAEPWLALSSGSMLHADADVPAAGQVNGHSSSLVKLRRVQAARRLRGSVLPSPPPSLPQIGLRCFRGSEACTLPLLTRFRCVQRFSSSLGLLEPFQSSPLPLPPFGLWGLSEPAVLSGAVQCPTPACSTAGPRSSR